MKNHRSKYREIYENYKTNQEEIDSEIDFVLEMLTGLKPIDFILGKTITEEQEQKAKFILKKRVTTGEPLQYIMGQAFFKGSKYFVTKNTLIPRPETELLIEECKKRLKNNNPKILDIGTGSGCIAIELAKDIPQAEIIATDISFDILDIAEKNADYHNVLKKITYVKSDLFENISGQFDIIVSNPPYISYNDIEEVQKDVYDFESHSALFAENNGLYFYKKITEQSKNYLNKNGLLSFEIGWKQAEKIYDIMIKNQFTSICLTKDLDGNNRIISGILCDN